MNIVYCETCGVRITQADFDAGQVERLGDNEYLCPKCAQAKAASAKAATVQATRATAEVRAARSTVRTTEARTTRTMARETVREPGELPTAKSNPMLIYVGVGAAALVVTLLIALGGRSKPAEKVAEAAPSAPPAPAVVRSPATPTAESAAPAGPGSTGGLLGALAQEQRGTKDAERPAPPPPKNESPAEKIGEPAAPAKPDAPSPASNPQALPVATAATEKPVAQTPPIDAAKPTPEDIAKLAEKPKPSDDDDRMEPGKVIKEPAKPADPAASRPAGLIDNKQPEPAKVPVAPAPPKIKPLLVKGQKSDLFPGDRASAVKEYAQGKRTIFEGWTWMSNDATGFSVKDGGVSLEKTGFLQLDGFIAKDYVVSMEVCAPRDNALGVLVGENSGVATLVIIMDSRVLPGAWDTNKAANNISNDAKAAKPHGIKDAWIPLVLSVHPTEVEVFASNKSVLKFPTKPILLTKFGFLTLSTKGAAAFDLKVRKLIMLAP